MWKAQRGERSHFKATLGKNKTLSERYSKAQRVGGMA
jgi:hypothetical protein